MLGQCKRNMKLDFNQFVKTFDSRVLQDDSKNESYFTRSLQFINLAVINAQNNVLILFRVFLKYNGLEVKKLLIQHLEKKGNILQCPVKYYFFQIL